MSVQRIIRLPWPPSKASSNGSQGDYHGKARARASYKQECAIACHQQQVQPMPAEGDVTVTVTYYPPRNGRLDWDNISNRAKQGFDAVAKAIRVDDGRWWPVTVERGEKVRGGAILVHVTPGKEEQ